MLEMLPPPKQQVRNTGSNSVNDILDDDQVDNEELQPLSLDSNGGSVSAHSFHVTAVVAFCWSSQSPWTASSASKWILIGTMIALVLLMYDNASQSRSHSSPSDSNTGSPALSHETVNLPVVPNVNDHDETALLEAMKRRLTPRRILLEADTADATSSTLTVPKHQFLHLHHMKTGGTSLDGLVNCGLSRLRTYSHADNVLAVNYSNIHECSASYYETCVQGSNAQCLEKVQTAAILSYCAPLKDLSTPFAWLDTSSLPSSVANITEPSRTESLPPPKPQDRRSRMQRRTLSSASSPPNETTSTSSQPPSLPYSSLSATLLSAPPLVKGAVTVLRHPVARVWSMYRFQTKNCYHCLPLTQIYALIDAGNASKTMTQMCQLQLLNHQTRNLLTTSSSNVDVPDSIEQVQEAIASLQSVFTMVGLTEDMPNTAKMVAQVFPWLAQRVTDWSVALELPVSTDVASATVAATAAAPTSECTLPHANKSPTNNRCGPGGTTHMDLPSEPDAETAAAILAHNGMDYALYQAGVELFALQKLALGIE
jgi:hypothetical protein